MQSASPMQLSLRAAFARLWRDWMRPYKAWLLLSLFLMLMIALASAGYAKFMEYTISAYEHYDMSVIYWGPGGIIFLTVIKGLSQYGQSTLVNWVLTDMQEKMQKRMFSGLVHMDLGHLMAQPPAALATRFSADIELVRNGAREVFGSVSAVFTIIATFAVMLSIDWAMTIGLIFIFALAFGPVALVGVRVRHYTRDMQSDISEMSKAVNEGLSGIRMVRTYQLEAHLESSAAWVFERLRRLRILVVRWQAVISPLMEILGGAAIAALLFLVALRMQAGAIDLGGFVGLLTALGVATNPARKLGGAYASAAQGAAALERIFELYDVKNSITDGTKALPAARARGEITFDHVGFTYPDGFEALKDITLTIKPGQTVAFVGRSGAGKSTVFNLLPRLFEATTGQITLDGIPLSDLPLNVLRRQISVVSQDQVLLTTSVLENIRFGRPEASEDEVITAAKAAAADAFILELEEGYQTQIIPSRTKLSGGERQRLSIARAILRDAPVLLLDEPTSALDAQSESAIRASLAELSKGRTTLVIAHRLSTILDADQIVVLEKGRVADMGTHEELLERGGIYADLFNLQFSSTGPRAPRRALRALSQREDERLNRSPLYRMSKFLKTGLLTRR